MGNDIIPIIINVWILPLMACNNTNNLLAHTLMWSHRWERQQFGVFGFSPSRSLHTSVTALGANTCTPTWWLRSITRTLGTSRVYCVPVSSHSQHKMTDTWKHFWTHWLLFIGVKTNLSKRKDTLSHSPSCFLSIYTISFFFFSFSINYNPWQKI